MIYQPLDFKIPEHNIDNMTEALVNKCLEIYNNLQEIMQDKRVNNPLTLREIQTFISTYFLDDKPTINMQAVETLQSALISKISFIDEQTLMQTAEVALEGLKKGDHVTFYIYDAMQSGEEFNIQSNKSFNSNQYMLRLVLKEARKRGIIVKILKYSKSDSLEFNDEEVRVIDDCAYKGGQLTTELGILLRHAKHKFITKIYLAGATDTSCKRILTLRESYNQKITISRIQKVKSLYELIGDIPEIRSFFSVRAIYTWYLTQREQEPLDQSNVQDTIFKYMNGTTLTRSIHNKSDFMSFPSEVGDLFTQDLSLPHYYPEVNINT